MTKNKVNEMCDKAIAVINNYGLANFISDKECNALTSEIQALKVKQDRSLASKLSERHENNMKHYVEKMKSNSDYSQDFVNLQVDCIFVLNEIEAVLYMQEKFES